MPANQPGNDVPEGTVGDRDGFTISECPLPGVLLIRGPVFPDHRGQFRSLYHAQVFAEHGVGAEFVLDNMSFSHRHVLRGLHYQQCHPQAKLVSVLSGSVFDTCVDVRSGSPTFGEWFGIELSAENALQLFVPRGFAHGVLALSASVVMHYRMDDRWHPECERAIRWDDPSIGIAWPLADAPILSERDERAPFLVDLELDAGLPSYQ